MRRKVLVGILLVCFILGMIPISTSQSPPTKFEGIIQDKDITISKTEEGYKIRLCNNLWWSELDVFFDGVYQGKIPDGPSWKYFQVTHKVKHVIVSAVEGSYDAGRAWHCYLSEEDWPDTTPTPTPPDLNEYKPIIYLDKNEKWGLSGVYYSGPLYGYDEYAGEKCYCIEYWFKFNGDGDKSVDDWEPVYVFIDLNGNVLYCASTIHYMWDSKDTETDDFENNHVKVYFAKDYHTPIIDYDDALGLRGLYFYVDGDPSAYFEECSYSAPSLLTYMKYPYDTRHPFSQERRDSILDEEEAPTPTPTEKKLLDLITAYTTKLDEKYERVFKYGTDFNIVVVLRNKESTSARINPKDITVKITDEYGKEFVLHNDEEYDIQAGKFKAIKFKWSCSKEDATWTGSGFTFVGKKFKATVSLGSQSKEYEFYIDEFGIPEWLRNVNFVEPPLASDSPSGDDIPSQYQLTEEKLKEYYEFVAQRSKDLGFDCIGFGEYYKYGDYESHDSSTIQHWFPASSSPYTYYNTPAQYLIDLVGSENNARKLIGDLVRIIHNKGLKTRAYTDPNGMYNPDSYGQSLDPNAVAHHPANDKGWARYYNGKVQRLNYLESIGIINPVNNQPIYPLSPIKSLSVEICPLGPSKLGMQDYGGSDIPGYDPDTPNFDYGFQPEDVIKDLSNSPKDDPSFHYQEVKQTLWLNKEYEFDGVCPDDTGRLIMKEGKAGYWDWEWLDPWTLAMHPEPPSKSLYGICNDDVYCEPLREKSDASEDDFALDAYANMIKHMRWQIRYDNEEGFLMSGDYFVPSDVGWESIVASEDVSVSDQFNIWLPSFARWAYKTFNMGYKVLRTDLRRSTDIIDTHVKIDGIPVKYYPQPIPALKNREDLTFGVLIATAWSNKAHVDINRKELFLDKETGYETLIDTDNYENTEKLIANYVKMKNKLHELYLDHKIGVPLFSEEGSQELLYHQRFENYNKDPDLKNVNVKGEYKFVGGKVCDPLIPGTGDLSKKDEPYTILYRLPCKHGEKGRVLHVMNKRVISDIFRNEEVAADYTFKIKIPEGEDINNIYLVSPDFYKGNIDPDRDGNPTAYEQQYFTSNITDKKGELWWIVFENSHKYIKVKVPHVIAYTAVLLDFKELEEPMITSTPPIIDIDAIFALISDFFEAIIVTLSEIVTSLKGKTISVPPEQKAIENVEGYLDALSSMANAYSEFMEMICELSGVEPSECPKVKFNYYVLSSKFFNTGDEAKTYMSSNGIESAELRDALELVRELELEKAGFCIVIVDHSFMGFDEYESGRYPVVCNEKGDPFWESWQFYENIKKEIEEAYKEYE